MRLGATRGTNSVGKYKGNGLFKKRTNQEETEIKSWYKDKYEFVRTQRDLLAAIALVSLCCTAAAVAAVMWLTPYKSVEPYLIQIDQKTGIVKQVEPVPRDVYTANEAIDRFFIAQYIRAREGYHPSVFMYDYNTVRVMSTAQVFQEYRRAVGEGNPESPIALLGQYGKKDIRFKNISFIKPAGKDFREPKIAQARILSSAIATGGTNARITHSVVTITFQYSNVELSDEERYRNPIGFLVTDYTIEREVV